MITRATLSSIEQGLPKYRSMLAGNTAYSPGSWDSIATVDAGGSSSVSISSIPSTYTALALRIYGRIESSVGDLRLQFNDDTGTNYMRSQLITAGSTMNAFSETNATGVIIGQISGTSYSNFVFSSFITIIYNYSTTNTFKPVLTKNGIVDDSSGQARLLMGQWKSTSAINKITFTNDVSVNFSSGTKIALYGLRSV